MAAANLYSSCTFRGACRVLRRIPLASLQIHCLPRFLPSVPSFRDLKHRSCPTSSPFLVPHNARLYCALNFPSGSRDRNLSQEEIELDEEISKLERRHRDAVARPSSSKAPRSVADVSSGSRDFSRVASQEEVDEETIGHREMGAKLAGSKARELKKSVLDYEKLADVASHESTHRRRSINDPAPERTSLRKVRSPEPLKQGTDASRKSSSLEVRQMVSDDEEDDDVTGSMLDKDFSSDEFLESGTESDADVREPKSGDSSRMGHSSHPWEEWTAFLDVLHRKNYFKESPTSASDGGGISRFQDASYTKHAIVEFGRERDDIIRFLTKKHIRTVVNMGCPSTDRKVVNAAKRLRMSCGIPEDEVCQQCKLKTFCTRAFAEPAPKIDAGTIDVVRVLYSFALNASPDAESQVAYPVGVAKSVCHLLNEIVQLSAYPRDPGFPKAKSLSSTNQSPVVKKTNESQDSDRRPGDWICPDCNFLNFSRNRECRECGTFRENAEQHLEPGDWECPECTFVNFRRNKECRECLTPRPKFEQADNESMEPGDWKCAECQFVNFRKNNECRRCSARRPKSTNFADVEELEPGDWRCPKCNFRNFRRNKECHECSTLRPIDTEWTSTEPRNDHRWGLQKPLVKSDGGWGSRQSISTSNKSSAGRLKYQEWKPDLKRHMDDDTDDDIEEEADIVFSKDDDTSVNSRGSFGDGSSSNEGSDNEFSFSDVEDEPSQRSAVTKATAKKNLVFPKFDDDDDDDMSDSFEEDRPPKRNLLKKATAKKNLSLQDFDDDDMSDSFEEDELPQRKSLKKAMAKKTIVSQKFYNDDMSDSEDDLSDDNQPISRGARVVRDQGQSFQKWDSLSEDEGGLSNGKKTYSGQNEHKHRFRGRDQHISQNKSSGGEMHIQRIKEEKKRDGRGRPRTSFFNSDDESDRYNRKEHTRGTRVSSSSSGNDRSSSRKSVRGSRTYAYSSDDDRSSRKGKDMEYDKGRKRAAEDTYSKARYGDSKARHGGRLTAKIRQ